MCIRDSSKMAGTDFSGFARTNRVSMEKTLAWFDRYLGDHPEVELVYRRHPSEWKCKALDELAAKRPNFHVIFADSVKQWIVAADSISIWMSTAVAEVYMAGKSCHILRPVPIDSLRVHAVMDNARLTLAPVRFSGDRTGLLRFATRADVSGPLAGGQIERLSVPLNGFVAPTGSFALNGGCSRVSADRVTISGFQIDRSAIDVCNRAGAPLLSAGPGGLRGQIRIPGINLRGTSGSSPFAVSSGPANIDLTAMRWTLALADFRLGKGDSVCLLYTSPSPRD